MVSVAEEDLVFVAVNLSVGTAVGELTGEGELTCSSSDPELLLPLLAAACRDAPAFSMSSFDTP